MKSELELEKAGAGDSLFLGTLQRHRAGAILSDAGEKLRAVVAAVHATGKPGSVTLVIKIKPAQRGMNAVVVTDRIAATIPTEEAESSFWYATQDGELRKEDPRQRNLALDVVEGGQPDEPMKKVIEV